MSTITRQAKKPQTATNATTSGKPSVLGADLKMNPSPSRPPTRKAAHASFRGLLTPSFILPFHRCVLKVLYDGNAGIKKSALFRNRRLVSDPKSDFKPQIHSPPKFRFSSLGPITQRGLLRRSVTAMSTWRMVMSGEVWPSKVIKAGRRDYFSISQRWLSR
jgi:hypothetical protein